MSKKDKTEDAVIHFEEFSNKSINFLSQLFENDRIIPSVSLKVKYELTNELSYLKHLFQNIV